MQLMKYYRYSTKSRIWALLCGHLIGSTMHLACPYVCPLSKNAEKSKLLYARHCTVSTAWVSGVKIFSCKCHRSRPQDVKTSKFGITFTYGSQHRRIKHGRRRLQTRPTPLLGLIYSQRLRRIANWQLDRRAHIMSALTTDMFSCLWRDSLEMLTYRNIFINFETASESVLLCSKY